MVLTVLSMLIDSSTVSIGWVVSSLSCRDLKRLLLFRIFLPRFKKIALVQNLPSLLIAGCRLLCQAACILETWIYQCGPALYRGSHFHEQFSD